MKTFNKALALCAGVLITATVASAAGRSDADVTRLSEAKRQLAAKANGQKGYPRARLDQERLRVSNLIDEIEAGKMVEPQAIDQALERANQADR